MATAPPARQPHAVADDADAALAAYAPLVGALVEGALVVDRRSRVVLANGAAARVFGVPMRALLGPVATYPERFRLRGLDGGAPAPIALEALAGQVVEPTERVIAAGDGGDRHVRTSAAPLRGPGGEVQGALVLVADTTEQRRTEDALREADRRKDEFLAVLSHELRNPLAPIRNSMYVLDHAAPWTETARRAREVIGRQVGHLARLVDDLLDVTRIGRGKIELRREPLDLVEVVRRAGEDHRELLEGAGVRLLVALPRRRLPVHGDPTRLAQVVGNLLQNAARFTAAGGEVSLSVAARGNEAEVRVRDTGNGFSPELGERLFRPFSQGEQTLARTGGGLGLGLALVRGLAELHGGTATAASDGPGRGAEFTVRLPLQEPPAPGAPGEAGAGPPTAAARTGRRVLVVDDNRDAAHSLAEVVELFGHAPEIAFDGPSALERARAHPPDIVLCDIGLPGMDGYDVARALRADPRLSHVRLVAVSGYARPEDRRRAAEAGFDQHVAKPPDLARIEEILSG